MADYKIVIVALTKDKTTLTLCADNGEDMKKQIDAISPLLYSKKLNGIMYGTLSKAYYVGVI